MGLDIRIPIGGMFAIIGLILLLFGIHTASDQQIYLRSLSINVNLWWGTIMLLFGAFMLFLGLRKPTKAK